MGDFDAAMLGVVKSIKNFQATPVQEIWHNDGDQVLAYMRKDLIFVFNFNLSSLLLITVSWFLPELMKLF